MPFGAIGISSILSCSLSVNLARLSHLVSPSSLLVDLDSLDFSARDSVKKLIITGPVWREMDEAEARAWHGSVW